MYETNWSYLLHFEISRTLNVAVKFSPVKSAFAIFRAFSE